MPVKDKLCFVQFIHPGKEHQPDKDTIKYWNSTRADPLDAIYTEYRDWIEHNKTNYVDKLKESVSECYFDVSVLPWYQDGLNCVSHKPGCSSTLNESYRLYFGANEDNKVNGMYSFFPCLLSKDESRGFARPIIRIPNKITDTLLQGKKLNPQKSLEQVKKLWEDVVQQVTDQGLMLGTYADLPKKK